MPKKEYEQGSYGAYLVTLIKTHNFSQAEFAKRINVSRTYLFDLFNGRVKPPAPEMQEKNRFRIGINRQRKRRFFQYNRRRAQRDSERCFRLPL